MEIVFKTPAANDVNEIFAWYNNQIPGLGNDFLYELETIFPYVIGYPTSFRIQYKKFRVVKLSRFPYLIYYTIEKERIIIHRINHAARSKRKLKL